jgi:hypothetical protein
VSVTVDEVVLIWEQDINWDGLMDILARRDEALEQLKRLWYEEYLLSLREQYGKLFREGWTGTIKADDIVLVRLPDKPRPCWLICKVLDLIVGFDSIVR